MTPRQNKTIKTHKMTLHRTPLHFDANPILSGVFFCRFRAGINYGAISIWVGTLSVFEHIWMAVLRASEASEHR